MEGFLTVREVAEELKVSEQSVRRWIKNGELHAYKVGHDWRIASSDLWEFLKARRSRP
jgi:excisionase family DNA binding protein